MKFPSTLLLTSTLFTCLACTGQNYQENSAPLSNAQSAHVASSNADQIVMKHLSDLNTGQVLAQMPLPASWKINSNPGQNMPETTGPGGIEIRSFAGKTFTYSEDHYTNQMYQQSGQQVRQPAGVETIVKQDLITALEQQGYRYEKMYALPSLARVDKAYSDQLYAYGQQQKSFQVAGAEFTGKDGKKNLLIVRYFETYSMGLYLWGYNMQNLSAPVAVFESAKQTYLYGLENIQYNQATIASYNAKESGKLSSDDAAFQNRMRQNQANFEATQRAHVNSTNAINEAQMGVNRSQSESFNRSNQQVINGIREENTIYNAANGETYQIEGHSDTYWMNANGDVIPSDNSLFDPNIDPNTNATQWVKGQKK